MHHNGPLGNIGEPSDLAANQLSVPLYMLWCHVSVLIMLNEGEVLALWKQSTVRFVFACIVEDC